MKLKYGQTSTYKYKLDEDRLQRLTDKTNRSLGQTQFLFQLVDGDFNKLMKLETQIKNCFYAACPADKKTVNKLLSMTPKSNWFSI